MTVHEGIDITSESFFADPFPMFERLRTEAPVYFYGSSAGSVGA